MCEHWALFFAILVVLVVVIAGAVGPRGTPVPRREGYLIYPYLDLDEPGGRGMYYAMTPGASDGAAGP